MGSRSLRVAGTSAGVFLLSCATSPLPALAPPAPEAPRALWEMAPKDASAGVVLRDGATPAVRETLRGFGAIPLFDFVAKSDWALAGLDTAHGGAVFAWPDRDRGVVVVLPVKDRALFRAAFHLTASVRDGREVEEAPNGYVCSPVAGRYACAKAVEELEAIELAQGSGELARAVSALREEDRGEIESFTTTKAKEVERMREAAKPFGSLEGVAAAIRVRPDGLTARVHVLAAMNTPRAAGFSGAPPPGELAPTAAASPSVARVHVDLAAAVPADADVEPKTRSELVEQLTGDFEVATSGSGLAGASAVALLKDPARVERYVKERCDQASGSMFRYALAHIAVTPHGCSAAFTPSMLPLPLKIPTVQLALGVSGDRLTLLVGDARTPSAGDRAYDGVVEGDGAAKALKDAAALVAFTRYPMVGPEIAPAKAFKEMVPFLNDRTMTFIDGWNDVAARIYQVYGTARVVPEGVIVSADVTTFAGDPAEARADYEAALEHRSQGNEAAYRAALADIEARHPGTRAGRRAAEVRSGSPFLGAFTLLFATLGRFAPKK